MGCLLSAYRWVEELYSVLESMPLKASKGDFPVSSSTVKETHINSVVSEILGYRQKILLLYIIG